MTKEERQKIISNELFIDLMMVAQNDQEIKSELLYVLRSDDLTRVDILKSWIENGLKNQAPEKFREALGFLTHREIAHEALRMLI
jgi:hypothetical protein